MKIEITDIPTGSKIKTLECKIVNKTKALKFFRAFVM